MEQGVMTKSRPRVPRRPASASGVVRTDEVGAGARTTRDTSTDGVNTDAFFRHIVSGMRNGVLAITRDGRVALINDEAYRIFGVSPVANAVGQTLSSLLKDHPDVVRVIVGAFDLHHLPNRVEMRLKPSNKVIGYTLAFVRDDDGRVIGASMFFKDLTRVEQLEERERLRDRLAAVGEMAAVIAHEVKNPLAGIEVMAGLLRRKMPDAPDAQVVLSDIINEAKMANAIVQEVLDFVRPIRLQVEHTAVADAVQGAIQLAETKARRGAVAVNVMLDDGGEAREAVLVEITDDGPGIAPDVAEKVFDPFFTTKAQGSGLGLAIVRKIVDAHDGRIDLRTSPGQGTTIRVTLPVTGGNEE
jgi:signal transduction histidine kinase